MSSILKALKKLEEDKVRSGESRVDIAADILRSQPESRGGRKWPLLLLLLVAGSGLGGWWYLASAPAGKLRPAPVAPPPEMADSRINPAASKQKIAPVAPVRNPGLNLQTETSPRHRGDKSDTPPMPKLVLSGIVYQADPASRMAIVNDLPVMTGGMVDGWLLEKIEVNQVHFTRKGVRVLVRLEEDGSSAIVKEGEAVRQSE